MKTLIQCVLTLIKNHQTVMVKISRELFISATILAGMLVHLYLSINVTPLLEYEAHYSLGFIKSFLALILTCAAVGFTDSNRLRFGLAPLLIISMGGDWSSIFSTDLYYLIEPYRYDNYYNFKDIFSTFEIACLLYSGANIIKITIGYMVTCFLDSHIADCNIFVSKAYDIPKKNKAR